MLYLALFVIVAVVVGLLFRLYRILTKTDPSRNRRDGGSDRTPPSDPPSANPPASAPEPTYSWRPLPPRSPRPRSEHL